MNIHHTENESKGYFSATTGGTEAGRMTYSRAGAEKIIIDHTEVNPQFKGQSVGKQMVLAAVEYARDQNIRIIPLCPFAKSVFKRIPEIRDVL
jgi:predicted GNAT family acetyltransferase